MKKILLVLLAFVSTFVCPVYAAETVVILRHGEKPAAGLGQLSCQGLQRSLMLPEMLINRFGSLDVFYAPNPGLPKMDYGHPYFYLRPLATLEPTAILSKKPVNLSYGFTETTGLAYDLSEMAASQQVVVVAWEHKKIPEIVEKVFYLNHQTPPHLPKWSDHDFDSLWVLEFQDGQWVLSQEFEHIIPSPDCF